MFCNVIFYSFQLRLQYFFTYVCFRRRLHMTQKLLTKSSSQSLSQKKRKYKISKKCEIQKHSVPVLCHVYTDPKEKTSIAKLLSSPLVNQAEPFYCYCCMSLYNFLNPFSSLSELLEKKGHFSTQVTRKNCQYYLVIGTQRGDKMSFSISKHIYWHELSKGLG